MNSKEKYLKYKAKISFLENVLQKQNGGAKFKIYFYSCRNKNLCDILLPRLFGDDKYDDIVKNIQDKINKGDIDLQNPDLIKIYQQFLLNENNVINTDDYIDKKDVNIILKENLSVFLHSYSGSNTTLQNMVTYFAKQHTTKIGSKIKDARFGTYFNIMFAQSDKELEQILYSGVEFDHKTNTYLPTETNVWYAEAKSILEYIDSEIGHYLSRNLVIFNDGWDMGEVNDQTVIYNGDAVTFLDQIIDHVQQGIQTEQIMYAPEVVIKIPLPHTLFRRLEIAPNCQIDDKIKMTYLTTVLGDHTFDL